MHTKNLQRGVASVEAILLVPFLLLLIMLIISTARFSSHIIHNSIDARTSAWRHALYGSCSARSAPRFGGIYKGSRCVNNSTTANAYLSSLSKSPEAVMFTAVLRGSGVPGITTATATSEFRPFGLKNTSSLSIVDQHSIDASPAWERRHMPRGYKRVLPRL